MEESRLTNPAFEQPTQCHAYAIFDPKCDPEARAEDDARMVAGGIANAGEVGHDEVVRETCMNDNVVVVVAVETAVGGKVYYETVAIC